MIVDVLYACMISPLYMSRTSIIVIIHAEYISCRLVFFKYFNILCRRIFSSRSLADNPSA